MERAKRLLEGFRAGAYNFNHKGEPISFNNGYMIGGFNEARLEELKDEPKVLEAIELTLKELEARAGEGLVLGLWINTIGGEKIIYIELSKNIINRDEAINKGLELKQLAIYDLNKGEELSLSQLDNGGIKWLKEL